MHILFGYIVESEVGENFLGVGPYGGLAHPARLVLRPVEEFADYVLPAHGEGRGLGPVGLVVLQVRDSPNTGN